MMMSTGEYFLQWAGKTSARIKTTESTANGVTAINIGMLEVKRLPHEVVVTAVMNPDLNEFQFSIDLQPKMREGEVLHLIELATKAAMAGWMSGIRHVTRGL